MLASCRHAGLTQTSAQNVCAHVCVCACPRALVKDGCRRWSRSFSGKTQTPNRRKPLECRPEETPSRTPHPSRCLKPEAWQRKSGGSARPAFFVMGWVWRRDDDLTDSETMHMTKSGGFPAGAFPAGAFLLFPFVFSGPWVSICRMSLLLQSLPAPWLTLHLRGSLRAFVNLQKDKSCI